MTTEPVAPTPAEVIKALNFQGAFFKKQVLRKLSKHLRVAEEYGTKFGRTTVADIIAYDGKGLFLVVECKKVSLAKKWVFMKHLEQRYRRSRAVDAQGRLTSILDESPPPYPLVCSEGYEISRSRKFKGWRADQDPIFQASAQLSAAFLGFVSQRVLEHNPTAGAAEAFVPVLITNAQLAFVTSDFEVDEATGEADPSSQIEDVPFVLLRHPFPQIDNEMDFRDGIEDDYQQRYQETVYVVNISRLNDFLSDTHRSQLRDPEPGCNPRNYL